MFTRNTILIWLGILLLAATFLLGQQAWHPRGKFGYVPNLGENTVTVFDADYFDWSSKITVGDNPSCAVITPDGRKVFVTNAGLFYPPYLMGSTVSVIDAVTNTVVDTIELSSGGEGTYPTIITMAPRLTSYGAQHAYVSNSHANTVSVIDTSTNSVVTTIDVGNFPFVSDFAPDHHLFLVPNMLEGTVSMIDTDASPPVLVATVGDGSFSTPTSVAVDPSETYAYVCNEGGQMYYIDLDTGDYFEVSAGTGSTNNVFFADFSTDGRYLFAASGFIPATSNPPVLYVIDTQASGGPSWHSTISLGPGSFPFHVLTNPANNKVYVSESGFFFHGLDYVAVVDGANLNVITTVPMGTVSAPAEFPTFITFSSNGAYAYVPCSNSGVVKVIRTSDNTVVGTVSTGVTPSWMAIQPVKPTT